LRAVLNFAFIPEFLAATSFPEPAEVCKTELKPFLTILGTNMRASFSFVSETFSIFSFWEALVFPHVPHQ
jgi:hypothetical protein